MVKIEGGAWRGRQLEVPSNKNLRPSTGKTKVSIFNILEAQRLKLGLSRELEGVRCLDLYAGVGSLGFEAMSRGADSVVFVEQDRLQLRALEKNARALSCEDRVTIFSKPVEKSWDGLAKLAVFDLVFIDPPYALHSFRDEIPFLLTLLAPDAWVVIEHDPKLKLAGFSGLVCQSTRTLGPAGISVYRKLS